MFRFFEKLLNPFPADRAGAPPEGLFAFCWHYVREARFLFVVLGLLTASIGVAEVMLFGFLGNDGFDQNFLNHRSIILAPGTVYGLS